MLKQFGLTKAVVGSKWLKDGLVANADGTLSRAYVAELLESGLFECDLNGTYSIGFFAKLADALSRVPDGFDGQILLQRKEHAQNTYSTKLYLLETVKSERAYCHLDSMFKGLSFENTLMTKADWDQLINGLLGACADRSLPDLSWDKNFVIQGKKEVRAVSLTELPQVTWAGCFQELFEQPLEFTFSIRLAVSPREKTRRRLESKRRVNHALSIASSVELQNIESNSVLGSSEETLERILVGKETLFEISSALILSAEAPACATAAKELVGVAAGIGNAGLYLEGVGVLPVLKSHIPGNRVLKIRQLPILSGNLSHLIPVMLDYSRLHDPSPLKLRSRCGEVSNLGLFSKANLNFNGLICGSSGAGKSFLMNSLIEANLAEEPKTKLCVFDVGGSYRKFIAKNGGVSKVLSPNEANTLLATYFKLKKVENNGLFRSLIEVLCGTGAHMTHSHRVAIGELLQAFQGQQLKIAQLIGEASKRDEIYYRDLAHWLKAFIHIDVLSTDTALLDLARMQMAAFDFQELSNDTVLERTSVLILSSLIWEDLKNGTHPRTIVVFDEVWRFFKGVKDYIEEMYRTFRKYSAGVVSITQNAADYGDDEFSRMIFSNSFTKIFLQGGASRSLLSAGLDLNSSDIERALSVASKKPVYSEFFVSSGAMSQVMRLYPSEEFYALANTENINV